MASAALVAAGVGRAFAAGPATTIFVAAAA